jgi:hypothetical protein
MVVGGEAVSWTGGTRSISTIHVSYNRNITATAHIHSSHHPYHVVRPQRGNSFSTPSPTCSFASFPFPVIRPRTWSSVSGTLLFIMLFFFRPSVC